MPVFADIELSPYFDFQPPFSLFLRRCRHFFDYFADAFAIFDATPDAYCHTPMRFH
jgi:hypothetical protein